MMVIVTGFRLIHPRACVSVPPLWPCPVCPALEGNLGLAPQAKGKPEFFPTPETTAFQCLTFPGCQQPRLQEWTTSLGTSSFPGATRCSPQFQAAQQRIPSAEVFTGAKASQPEAVSLPKGSSTPSFPSLDYTALTILEVLICSLSRVSSSPKLLYFSVPQPLLARSCQAAYFSACSPIVLFISFQHLLHVGQFTFIDMSTNHSDILLLNGHLVSFFMPALLLNLSFSAQNKINWAIQYFNNTSTINTEISQ